MTEPDSFRVAVLNQTLMLDALSKEINLVVDEATRKGLLLRLSDVLVTTQIVNDAATDTPSKTTQEATQ